MHRQVDFALLVMLAFLPISCFAGQRYIEVGVERDGMPLLHAGYGVSDALGVPAIWQSLQRRSFQPAGTIEPLAADPQKAVLTGGIRIVIRHVGRELARAQVDELQLIRTPGSIDQWQLAPGEVERTAKLAGL
jgi:hypothetical protein